MPRAHNIARENPANSAGTDTLTEHILHTRVITSVQPWLDNLIIDVFLIAFVLSR